MPKGEHLILCGGVPGPRRGGSATLQLDLHGAAPNVHLKMSDISRKLLARLPERLVDLLEVASYVYAADSAISRGGRTDSEMGARWRRNFRFRIPVREPDLWASHTVTSSLVDTLSFLSDDQYAFEFLPLKHAPSMAGYLDLELAGSQNAGFSPDEVILFSG